MCNVTESIQSIVLYCKDLDIRDIRVTFVLYIIRVRVRVRVGVMVSVGVMVHDSVSASIGIGVKG